jgi:hypothetical protein
MRAVVSARVLVVVVNFRRHMTQLGLRGAGAGDYSVITTSAWANYSEGNSLTTRLFRA